MIVYFSGTGNSKWIAEQLAEQINDKAVDVSELQEYNREDAVLGIVFPVYAWAPPEIILEFAKKYVGTSTFTFGVCTCADEAGLAMQILNQYIPLSSMYSLKMPNNYIVGSSIESEQVIKDKLAHAKTEIARIAQEVQQHKKVHRVTKGKFASIKSKVIAYGFNNFARTTKPFYVTADCIGCEKCQKQCPTHTIQMVNNKPSWHEKCYQCLRCINLCPTEAIQYGKSTINKKRYRLKEYL